MERRCNHCYSDISPCHICRFGVPEIMIGDTDFRKLVKTVETLENQVSQLMERERVRSIRIIQRTCMQYLYHPDHGTMIPKLSERYSSLTVKNEK